MSTQIQPKERKKKTIMIIIAFSNEPNVLKDVMKRADKIHKETGLVYEIIEMDNKIYDKLKRVKTF